MPSSMTDPISKIEELNGFLAEIFKDCAMAFDISRIALQYLKNWGIIAERPDDIDKIREMALRSHLREWEGTDDRVNRAMGDAIAAIGLEDGDARLNTIVGVIALSAALQLHDKKRIIRIFDNGAGDGATSDAFLQQIKIYKDLGITNGVERYCELYLNEPSYKRVGIAIKRLKSHPVEVAKIAAMIGTHETIFPMIREDFCTIEMSSALYHHMITPHYLTDLHRTLADDGMLIISDWYGTLWKNPVRAVKFLQMIGLDNDNINRFMGHFNITWGDVDKEWKGMDRAEEGANLYVINFLSELNRRLVNIKGPTKFGFTEALESIDERMKKIKNAGFETDLQELKKNNPAFKNLTSTVRRLYPTDNAFVIAVGKKR